MSRQQSRFGSIGLEFHSYRRLRAVLPLLGIAIIIGVFWWLKLTGIALAGEAFCGMDEHVHGEGCELRLVCIATEDRLHIHGDGCYDQILRCTIPETDGHTHSEACTGRSLVCQENHSHDEEFCYQDGLTCGKEEQTAHTHGVDCYEQALVCELPEFGAHTHGDACYEGVCGMKAHIHVESCYSDITADLETPADWEPLLTELAETHGTREKVISVAKSQIGCGESTVNFQVDDLGVRRGITRYGQWYGNPYGDWSAMFVSFCLHYAGVEDVPTNGGSEAMRLEWESAGFYTTDLQSLMPGDLLFLRKDGNGETAGSVAIIIGLEDGILTFVEGDVDGAVAEDKYAMDDPAILGGGHVPTKDSVVMLAPALKAAGDVTVWLDGTNGGMGHLRESDDTPYTVQTGSILKLPETWPSPDKYSYTLRGWYDISNSKYYPAGAEMEVTGNAVLYADWVASSYDVGVYNEHVVNTTSTNDFITTYLFDYNYLFDLYSAKATITVNNREHSESWTHVSSGKVAYSNADTLNFVFISNESSRGFLCDLSSRSEPNSYHAPGHADEVYEGIYNAKLAEILFSTNNSFDPATGQGILGKTYVGTGDHLYQMMSDPTDEHYGYYYYDSKRNAASYNQSAGRFYLYNYLSATSDSLQDGRAYSDFLPFNSPYANTNGKKVGTYTYDGINGQYKGVTHYRFDSKYNSGDYNSVDNAMANYGYGMRSDIDFFLPNDPGDANGNKDLYGNDMQFQFSGDDDVWVLVDGTLVLDIGGIHQVTSGSIDFSTGAVQADGNSQTNLKDLGITAGEHTLTILYLERGSSMSNCAIYFNLAPRYQLTIQKEDVLSRDLLNGAQFSVFTDRECKVPAKLWSSKAENDADEEKDDHRNTFEVVNGVASMWGFVANETYYLRETKPPDGKLADGQPVYSCASGLISVHIDRLGHASYNVEMLEELDENGDPIPVGNGFTAYGFRFDEETHQAYLVVTNAPKWVQAVTQISVFKQWDDNKDHSGDTVEVYLTVTDSDGTVRRVQSMLLSSQNDWTHTWTNMPKYQQDGVTPIVYGVEEAYISGYYGTVQQITTMEQVTVSWQDAEEFERNGQYLLKTKEGYLSATENNTLKWEKDEEVAKNSPLALWTASADGTASKLTNGAGQVLVYNSGNNNNSRYFTVTTSSSGNNNITINDNGRMYYDSSKDYYFTSINANGRGATSDRTNNALVFTRVKRSEKTTTITVDGLGFLITNAPLDRETSVKVTKAWVAESADLYNRLQVQVRLLADGKDTGRTLNMNLQNGWTGTFRGLPYTNPDGSVVIYTVEEVPLGALWTPTYQVDTVAGTTPTYQITLTNTYGRKESVELPSTGSAARLVFIVGGCSMALLALTLGIMRRRRREGSVE